MATMSLEEKNTTGASAQIMHMVSVVERTEEVFKQQFCHRCFNRYFCIKDSETIKVCKQLVNTGTWRGHFHRQQVYQRDN